MTELRIPLPKSSKGNAPSGCSFRWCAELHKALQPLRQYKLMDGSDAVIIHITSGPEQTSLLFHQFDGTGKRSGGLIFNDPRMVALVVLRNANFCTIEKIYLTIYDFANNANTAKEKFTRIIQHLEEHAVPQIAPEWISKALSALSGK